MIILLLDEKRRYSNYISSLCEAKEIQLDIVTPDLDLKNGAFRKWFRNRKELFHSQDRQEYDYILDCDVVTAYDIEILYQHVQGKAYILMSTMQVYGLLGKNKIFREDDLEYDKACNLLEAYNPHRMSDVDIYRMERLKCENAIRKLYVGERKSIILRLGKVFFKEDYYNIFRWIVEHERKDVDYCFPSRVIGLLTGETPIYIDDVIHLISELLDNPPKQSITINVCQDEVVSFVDIVKMIKELCFNESHTSVRFFDNEKGFEDLRYPLAGGFLLNNGYIKQMYAIEYTPTSMWVKVICNHIIQLSWDDFLGEKDEILSKRLRVLHKKEMVNNPMESYSKGRIVKYERT